MKIPEKMAGKTENHNWDDQSIPGPLSLGKVRRAQVGVTPQKLEMPGR
jgi:hypothetical protein